MSRDNPKSIDKVGTSCTLRFIPHPRILMPHTTVPVEQVKALPILTVARRLGMRLVKTGAGIWNEKDPDVRGGVTSLTIFEKTNNFVRFSGRQKGGCSKGSVIDLVRHVMDNPDFADAVRFLANLL